MYSILDYKSDVTFVYIVGYYQVYYTYTYTMECAICTIVPSKSNYTTCWKCKTLTCHTCTKECLVRVPYPAACTNPTCKATWNTNFLYSQSKLPVTWLKSLKGYKGAYFKRIMEIEHSKIPQTLIKMEMEKTRAVHEMIKSMENHYMGCYYAIALSEARAQLRMENRISTLSLVQQLYSKTELDDNDLIRCQDVAAANVRRKIKKVCKKMDVKYKDYMIYKEKNILPDTYQSLCPCPSDGCRGTISRDDYRCIVCSTEVCSKCRVVLDDGHKCDKNDLETMDILRVTTKPCPKCAVLITKIDGCDQLWCSSCHAVFNWDTGLLDRGRIHNPDAIQWMTKNNAEIKRDPLDIPCGGFPSLGNLYSSTIQVPLQQALGPNVYARSFLKFFSVDLQKYIEDRLGDDEPREKSLADERRN